jgi:hypothetical protein
VYRDDTRIAAGHVPAIIIHGVQEPDDSIQSTFVRP